VELGELLARRTAYARETLAALPGVSLAHERPVVREFALTLEAPVAAVVERCAAEGVNPGLALGEDGLLVAITEQRSRADIDRLADVLGRAVKAESDAPEGGDADRSRPAGGRTPVSGARAGGPQGL
jgi:glycine dehydrogenase subunit 1